MARHDPLPEDLRERAAGTKPSPNGHAPNLSGAEVLGALVAFIRRFVALSYVQAYMLALWVIHTHAIDAADCTPLTCTSRASRRGVARTVCSKSWRSLWRVRGLQVG